jgi:hypothetical protein
LHQQIAVTADAGLQALERELRGYPALVSGEDEHVDGEVLGIAAPLRLRTEAGVLSFISTTTVFGSPVDVTLQELALETFFPADSVTAQALGRMSGMSSRGERMSSRGEGMSSRA